MCGTVIPGSTAEVIGPILKDTIDINDLGSIQIANVIIAAAMRRNKKCPAASLAHNSGSRNVVNAGASQNVHASIAICLTVPAGEIAREIDGNGISRYVEWLGFCRKRRHGHDNRHHQGQTRGQDFLFGFLSG